VLSLAVSSLSWESRPTKCSFLGKGTSRWDRGVAKSSQQVSLDIGVTKALVKIRVQ